MLSSQAQPHKILRQQETSESLKKLRFILAHPQQLRKREVGQCWIRSQRDDAFTTYRGFQPVALPLCSLIAPDERWSKNLITVIEQHRPVHLTCESYGRNLLWRRARGAQHLTNAACRSLPPVLGILVCPSGRSRTEGLMLGRGGRDNRPIRVDQYGA